MTSISQHDALLDTNILYPAGMRDILLQLAVHDLYRPKWSTDIFREWMRIDRRIREDHDPAKVLRTQKQMDSFFFDAQITGYEHEIDLLNLPDPEDRHVLAAAIQGDCEIIVTRNLSHFPAEILDPYGIEAHSPDDFS